MLAIVLRSIAFLFFLILVGFTYLQINDPDPVRWIVYYLICALVPLMVAGKRFFAPLFWLATILSVIVVGIYVPGAVEYLAHASEEPLMQSMNPQKPYIEEARELIGGAIALVLVLVSRLLHRKPT